MLGVVRFQRGEFEAALALIDRALALRPARRARGSIAAWWRTRSRGARPRPRSRARPGVLRRRRSATPRSRGRRPTRFASSPSTCRSSTAIPENDAWWGEGFTEWTNVRRARPTFAGHAQPHVPGELGYYDLTDPATREAQARARAGARHRRVLLLPLLVRRPAAAASGRSTRCWRAGAPDFPFCVCWANENWTRRWDGLDHEVLMAQRYSDADGAGVHRAPAAAVPRPPLRARRRPAAAAGLQDRRHSRTSRRSCAVWRDDRASRRASARSYLAAVQRHAARRPHGARLRRRGASSRRSATRRRTSPRACPDSIPRFRGSVFGYANLAADYLLRPRPAFRQFRGVTPMWDNTARRPHDGMVVDGATPEAFGVWLEHVLRQTRRRHCGRRAPAVRQRVERVGRGQPPRARCQRTAGATSRRLAHARAVARARPTPARPSFDDVVVREAAAGAAGGDRLERRALRCRGSEPRPGRRVGRDARVQPRPLPARGAGVDRRRRRACRAS